jgi:hypothetical protein
MTTELTSAIQTIVDSVPPGCFFDSHFVIASLRKQPADEVHRFCADFRETKAAHARLSKQIARCGAERVGIAWSETIRQKPGKCACWRRLGRLNEQSEEVGHVRADLRELVATGTALRPGRSIRPGGICQTLVADGKNMTSDEAILHVLAKNGGVMNRAEIVKAAKELTPYKLNTIKSRFVCLIVAQKITQPRRGQYVLRREQRSDQEGD